ncbi:hypothetical protein BD413DRAFT_165286 [Trametes elegans]|nr:hypothetical protein BD413DRAFT_165286 [Trametes elegans]
MATSEPSSSRVAPTSSQNCESTLIPFHDGVHFGWYRGLNRYPLACRNPYRSRQGISWNFKSYVLSRSLDAGSFTENRFRGPTADARVDSLQSEQPAMEPFASRMPATAISTTTPSLLPASPKVAPAETVETTHSSAASPLIPRVSEQPAETATE